MRRDPDPEQPVRRSGRKNWLGVIARAAAGAAVILAFVFALLSYRSDDGADVEKLKQTYKIGQPDHVIAFDSAVVPANIQFSRSSPAWTINANGRLEETPEGQPRVTAYGPYSGGWLIEESRTNIALFSREPGRAPWRVSNGSALVKDGNPSAPDASRKAVLLQGQRDKCATLTQAASSDEANAPYTASVYLKADGTADAILGIEAPGSSATSSIAVTLDDSEVRVTAKPALGGYEKLGDGWVRVWTTVRTKVIGPIHFSLQGGCNNAKLWAWGAQLEKGIGATSFIPTDESPVTRAADRVVSKDVNWVEQATGTFVIDGVQPAGPSWHSGNVLIAGDGSDRNGVRLYLDNSGGLHGSVLVEGELAADFSDLGFPGADFRVVFVFSKENAIFGIRGRNYATAPPKAYPSSITHLDIGQYPTGTLQFNGVIKRIAYYKQAFPAGAIGLLY